MLRRTSILLRHQPLLTIRCMQVPQSLSCRPYTTKSLLEEINFKMFRVLDDSAARNEGHRQTITLVLRLAQQLRDNNIKFNSETFEHILSAYSKSGNSASINMLLKQMEGAEIQPTKKFCYKALQLAAKTGDATMQAKVLHVMEKYRYPRTTKVYHYMLLCMRDNLELERALDTLDQMKEEGLTPGLLTYLSMIDMAVHLQQPAIASELLEEAEKLSTFRLKDQLLYMHVLRCAAVEGHYESVKTNWKKAVMDGKYRPDEGICLHVLDIAARHGDPKLASDVIRVIGEEGFSYRECHFAPLIEAFASTGNIIGTFQVLSSMRKVGVAPSKASALPIVYKLGKDVNAIRSARDTMIDMLQKGETVDIVAFNLIIHALAFNKQYDEAISLYGSIGRLGIKPNSETLDATLDACIHCKDADLGISIYRECISQNIKATVSTLSKMVTLLCTQEDYEDAFKYLEKMKKLNMIPLRGCYYKLVKTLSRANDPRLNIAIEDMKAYGYPISTHLEEFIEKEEEKRVAASELE